MNVETLRVGQYGMNCYLCVSPDSGELFIVDPGDDAPRIISAIGDRKPVAVLLTHGHYDHIAACDELCSHFGIPLYIHELDAPLLTDTRRNVSYLADAPVVVNTVPELLTDGQTLSLAGIDVTVMHTPGHTRGSCCFLLPGAGGVLCGDTLFNGGYGRTDFPDGSFHDLKESLRKLMRLTPRRIAYPGHEATTYAGRNSGEAEI